MIRRCFSKTRAPSSRATSATGGAVAATNRGLNRRVATWPAGGALAITTKNGRDDSGGNAEVSGGSWGRKTAQLEQGGTITFVMGPNPNKQWGAAPADAPFSMSAPK